MLKQNEDALPDFRIFETDEFLKRFENLTSRDAKFLRRKIDEYVYPQLKYEPFWGKNIKKLHGYTPDTWRYRIGKFRLFYIVERTKKIVHIITIDDRKDAYS